MGERLECPGCGAVTSGVLQAVRDEQPCPHCGLSAQALMEIRAVRSSQADQELRDRLTDALKHVDRLERDNQALRTAITEIEDALEAARSALREDET